DSQTCNQSFVAVQYAENPNLKLEDVLNIYATGTNQPHGVKLGQLVNLRFRNDAVELNHVSLYRTFDVLVNTENRDIGNVAAQIDKELAGIRTQTHARIQDLEAKYLALEHKPGTTKTQLNKAAQEVNGLKSVRWELRGEYERMNESFSSLRNGLIMAAILVYLLMVPLFRSYLGPFIIMFTVPLGLIGVLAMLFLTRTTLNVQSEMGVIFLVGIVVSNGVLLVDFANKQRT